MDAFCESHGCSLLQYVENDRGEFIVCIANKCIKTEEDKRKWYELQSKNEEGNESIFKGFKTKEIKK